MNKKYKIDVEPLGISIKRALVAEMIGNFNPMYCTFRKQKHLVYSREGDLSDPFRVEKSYFNSLYIKVNG
jgi:hypothetical protein